MRVIVSPRARRHLHRLSHEVIDRVEAAIDALADDPRPPGCLLLHDYDPPSWRVRVGDWRILYVIDDDAGVVTVTGVRHRAQAY